MANVNFAIGKFLFFKREFFQFAIGKHFAARG